jgi:hypothetical protein
MGMDEREGETGELAEFTCQGLGTVDVKGRLVGLFPEAQIGSAGKPVARNTFELKYECETEKKEKQLDQSLLLLPQLAFEMKEVTVEEEKLMTGQHLVAKDFGFIETEVCQETSATIEFEHEGEIRE